MKNTLHVRIDELMAAMLFSSTDESRYVLNGVHIECKPGAKPILVSTDGRRLSVIETDSSQPEDCPPFEASFVLRTDILKPLCAFAKKITLGEIAIELHLPKRVIVHFLGGNSVLDCEDGALVEGDFPKWRACLPVGEKQPVPQVCINAEFIGDFAKASKILGCDAPLLHVHLFTANSAIEVRLANKANFYGIVMPANGEATEFQPEFVGMPESAPKAQAA